MRFGGDGPNDEVGLLDFLVQDWSKNTLLESVFGYLFNVFWGVML